MQASCKRIRVLRIRVSCWRACGNGPARFGLPAGGLAQCQHSGTLHASRATLNEILLARIPLHMTRREALALLAAGLGRAASRIPVNRNMKWGLGSNLWNYF